MRRAGWVVAVMAAAVLGGCGSDDDGPVKPPPPTGYPERTSPQNVLEAMQMAYTARDSNETKQVYDSSYVGTSTDFNDPVPSVATFRYADEIRHVAVLARTSTIVSIVLDLGLRPSWTRLPSDDPSHPEWAMIQINNFRLDVYDGSTLYAASSTNPMTFTFRPMTTAPPDTTWTIVRWTENGSSGP